METLIIKIARVLILIAFLNGKIFGFEIMNTSVPRFKVHKLQSSTNKAPRKWPEEKTTNKQYEVFNILWQKTKFLTSSKDIFPNVSVMDTMKTVLYNQSNNHKYIKPRSQIKKSVLQTNLKLNMKPSTPSYIEFDYQDDLSNKISHKYTVKTNNNRTGEYKFAFLQAPFHMFRRNDATSFKIKVSSFAPTKTTKNETNSQLDYLKSQLNETIIRRIHTTAYDRIRFFEIYDKDTPEPSYLQKNEKKSPKTNDVRNKEISYLDESDGGFHYRSFSLKMNNINVSDNERKTVRRNIERDKYSTPTSKSLALLSQTVAWSDYPFVTVYVYESEQIRCDCAAISPHWLVGAATCLHRYNKKNQEDSRSAFVTYCSGNWRLPGRITYVSQCIVHPQFHPKNYTRRHLYNIGAIQVVNSMSNTCNGWRPISLMSHHFVAEKGGSPVTALGWGLDRYDTRYTVGGVPEHDLMMYQGFVYSNFCPGNIGYSEAQQLNEASVKNVYCLSLPPYVTEEHDTIHGSLLLMGGKLMALYSQEERRRWGEQSALYTGIWHLIPWLNDIAREEEDVDLLDSDMYKYSK